jgi:hypothetical protein
VTCRSDTHPLFFARYEKAKSQDEHRSKIEEEKKKAAASRAHTSTAEEVCFTLTHRKHPPSPSLPTLALFLPPYNIPVAIIFNLHN